MIVNPLFACLLDLIIFVICWMSEKTHTQTHKVTFGLHYRLPLVVLLHLYPCGQIKISNNTSLPTISACFTQQKYYQIKCFAYPP